MIEVLLHGRATRIERVSYDARSSALKLTDIETGLACRDEFGDFDLCSARLHSLVSRYLEAAENALRWRWPFFRCGVNRDA